MCMLLVRVAAICIKFLGVNKMSYSKSTLKYHKPPKPENQQKLCDKFNAECPVGTRVKYWTGLRSDGISGETTTISAAEMLSGHTAVVYLANVRGCVALTHVEKV